MNISSDRDVFQELSHRGWRGIAVGLYHAIGNFHGLELNGTCQLPAYDDIVNLLAEYISTTGLLKKTPIRR
jgi:hypothetical protein